MKKLLIAVCVMGCILMGSAQGKITYIDAELNNTTVNGNALVLNTNYSTSHSTLEGLWGWRTNRTDTAGDGIWVTDGGAAAGVYDRESTEPLKVDITLPLANVSYDLYAIIMNNKTGAGFWDVSTRIGPDGDFTSFNKNSAEMTLAVKSDFVDDVNISTAVEGDQTFKVMIGRYTPTADNEVVSIYVNGLDSWEIEGLDQRTHFDGVGYEATPPYAISPADGATGVETPVTLQWGGGLDPNALGHYVYFGTDPESLGCLNPESALSPTAGQYADVAIAENMTYYWQVLVAIDTGSGNNYDDPNNVLSPIWSFESVLSKPVIITNPTDLIVLPGETAEFSVEVDSQSTPTYTWYSSPDSTTDTLDGDEILSYDAVLTLSNVTSSDEGYYYCVVTNDSEINVYSSSASLAVKRLMAHWDFDDYNAVDNQYVDVSGEGHNADPNGTPTFVTGQVNNGISILCESGSVPTTESWASAGTWGISDLSGMLTVSFWINWSGPKSTYVTQNIICKGGESGTDWRVLTNGNGNLALSSSKATLTSSNAFLEIGTWVYCTIAFDGSVASFYKNGELVSSGSFRLGGADDGMLCLGGKYFDTNPEGWMNGSLDEVRIYNYDLSEMEVARLYIADKPNGSVCIASLKPDATYDINSDCIVNISDFAMLAAEWLNCGLMPDCVQ